MSEVAEEQVESGLCQLDCVDDADRPAVLVLGLNEAAAGGCWIAGKSLADHRNGIVLVKA